MSVNIENNEIPQQGKSPRRDALEALVQPIVTTHQAELVDLELVGQPGSHVLRLYVEKAGSAEAMASTRDAAISLQLCADISRDLSPLLDVHDIIPGHYNLEVSSPGVERPLRRFRDFKRFAGKKAKLKLRSPVGGDHVKIGLIGEVTGDERAFTVALDGVVTPVASDNIDKANLVFEFGPTPKPGFKAPQSKKKK